MALSKIKTASIADDAVTSAKVATSGIATIDMADGSVTSLKIADGAIGTADIGDNSITTAKVSDGNITPAKLSTGAPTWTTGSTFLVGINTARTDFFRGSGVPLVQVEGSVGNTNRFLSLTFNNNGATGPIYILAKTRSSSNSGLTTIINDDELGQISFQGADGTYLQEAASIVSKADGTVSLDNLPGRISFNTRAPATSSVSERLRIQATGGLITYGTTLGEATNLATSSSSAALLMRPWASSSWSLAFGSASGNRMYLQGVDAAGTQTREVCLNPYGGAVAIGTASNFLGNVLTVNYPTAHSAGFFNHSNFMAPNMTGGGLSVGFGKAGSSYNLGKVVYNHTSDGSQDNYVGIGLWDRDNTLNVTGRGRVGIGTTSPTSTLDVNPDGITYSYGGYVRLGRNTTLAGGNVLVVETTGSSSSEDVTINANNVAYSNSTTPGWGQLRIMCARTASTAWNFLTACSNGGGDPEFFMRGDGQAYADGSWNGGGADYAEYFESVDGESIAVGTTVVLENGKVRASTQTDQASSIMGVIRPAGTSATIGNTAQTKWTKKYLTDDFGAPIMEEYTEVKWSDVSYDEDGEKVEKNPVSYIFEDLDSDFPIPSHATYRKEDDNGVPLMRKKLNPEFNPDITYTPRENRKEWNIVGLLGQIPVKKGQPIGERWIKMHDVSENVEMWMVR